MPSHESCGLGQTVALILVYDESQSDQPQPGLLEVYPWWVCMVANHLFLPIYRAKGLEKFSGYDTGIIPFIMSRRHPCLADVCVVWAVFPLPDHSGRLCSSPVPACGLRSQAVPWSLSNSISSRVPGYRPTEAAIGDCTGLLSTWLVPHACIM